MRPAKLFALILVLCLMIPVMPVGLAEEDLTDETLSEYVDAEVALADSVGADTGLTVDDGEEAADNVDASEAVETPEAEPAAMAAAASEYRYAMVCASESTVYRADDTWEIEALLHADDVLLVTGEIGGRAAVAFYADGEVLVGYMDLSELLLMDEEQTAAYQDRAATAGTATLYNGDLSWPLLPLESVVYGDNRIALASNYTDYSNDRVFTLNGKEIYANMVPDTGSGNCWRWAQGIYQLAWGCRFSETFKGKEETGLNLLSNMNDAQRKLTPTHLKVFIQNTTPGATIRVCACTSECSSFNNDGLSCGHNGHSLIVVDKNADGVFTMDSHSNSQHTRFYSWQGFCNAWKGYPYVKYIKWPGASPLPSNAVSEDGSSVPVTGVTLSESSITLKVGETATLTAAVAPSNASDQTVLWASGDSTVASVSGGVVTAVKAGTTTVAVKTNDGGKTATCTVTVKLPVAQKALTTTGKNGTVILSLGDKLQLSADFATSRGWELKSVKSSKKKVASVSETGLVTAISQGKAKITVATRNRKKATLTVLVVDPSVPATVVLNKKGPLKMKVGETLKLEATVLPETATTVLAWKSSKPRVAAVDDNGNVIALKKGSATIAVRTANGKLAKIKIKVSRK